MDFKFDDLGSMFSHWMLNDHVAVNQIVKSDLWVNEKRTVVRVTVNGVELNPALIEKYLQDAYDMKMSDLVKSQQEIETLIVERAEKLLQDRADEILSAMFDLQHNLRNASDILKPHWEVSSVE